MCSKCPHGPYYWLVWREVGGRKREQYIGKAPPGVHILSFPPLAIPKTVPRIGSLVTLATSTTWLTLGAGMRPIRHSLISPFYVDGNGVSPMGASKLPSAWISLRTQDGQRIYRSSRAKGSAATAVGSSGDVLDAAATRAAERRSPWARRPAEDDEFVPPGDTRWPLRYLPLET